MIQKDLLKIAMPLVSLSQEEWNVLNSFVENTKTKPELHKVLTTLCSNQAKIEVAANYSFFYNLEEALPDKSIEL